LRRIADNAQPPVAYFLPSSKKWERPDLGNSLDQQLAAIEMGWRYPHPFLEYERSSGDPGNERKGHRQ
jgi:hypothetical protein